MYIHEIFSKIKNSASTKDKVAVAKENRNSLLDLIFAAAYDGRTYGVTSNQVNADGIGYLCLEDVVDELTDLLIELSTRTATGNAAVKKVEDFATMLYYGDREIFLSILDRNLQIGMSFETYQKKVMGIKPTKFMVTLAQHLEDTKGVNPLDGTWYASRKCDGVRCVAFYNPATNDVKFISRQGKEFTTLENLKPAVRRFLEGVKEVIVLDGELCKIDANGDEHFDQIVGECKKKNHTITECCYQLFDIATQDEFYEHSVSVTFDKRYDTLKWAESRYEKLPHESCFIKVLKQEAIRSQEDFDRWEGYVAEGNWEGFMLRKNVPFETGRTKNLLKVKKFHDAEYIVEGVETGTLSSAEPGAGIQSYNGVTALLITHKGFRVHVGSGMTKEQRKEWYANPAKIIGKMICVKYFQESKDLDGNLSLRFPTLKFVYENGRNC